MLKIKKNKSPKDLRERSAQAIIEFTFSMIVVFLMIYGIMMIFRWTGVDLALRRMAHDKSLVNDQVMPAYDIPGQGPLKQITPYFYSPSKMNAVWEN